MVVCRPIGVKVKPIQRWHILVSYVSASHLLISFFLVCRMKAHTQTLAYIVTILGPEKQYFGSNSGKP